MVLFSTEAKGGSKGKVRPRRVGGGMVEGEAEEKNTPKGTDVLI